MFVIKPKNPADWQYAMFILSYYTKLIIELFSNGEDADTAYMVVRGKELMEGEESDLMLAEMAFQMNWHQANGWVCPHCDNGVDPAVSEYMKKNGRLDVCGHLTFDRPINPAF